MDFTLFRDSDPSNGKREIQALRYNQRTWSVDRTLSQRPLGAVQQGKVVGIARRISPAKGVSEGEDANVERG